MHWDTAKHWFTSNIIKPVLLFFQKQMHQLWNQCGLKSIMRDTISPRMATVPTGVEENLHLCVTTDVYSHKRAWSYHQGNCIAYNNNRLIVVGYSNLKNLLWLSPLHFHRSYWYTHACQHQWFSFWFGQSENFAPRFKILFLFSHKPMNA